ncbi:MAG: Dehydrogenases with different specificities (related to short-chain alcohol dehydrogenases) [uncultured Sphingomonadaceae bacterium]|uniref:Dehydrogenases with different specificities (Related to short-chain alcohol dehydrogenases) n=1 Tax=uncultured Sphingomonadaceae bacterium TaxID=169976 RepID=A0A6J4S101_9SPHN|nr:MAG: Dehydrogenases with different specificities (related to short-chain alcohol dehydrogenases) [uncultured Sphingomonadaceae bacterium]
MTQPPQSQQVPGTEGALTPRADHGEQSYRGSGRLAGKAAVITGGDSGIGRAVAIAYAREGADLLISYLNEDEDARETARWVEEAGRRCVLVPGDIGEAAHCRTIIARADQEFGRLDVLVNNAAFQMSRTKIEEIPDDEWERTWRTNISAIFHLCKAAAPLMKEGGAIINTTSIQSDRPSPELLAYASTKGAIANFTAGLAQMLGPRGIRVNSVAPGPIWTPLIPSTMPPETVAKFGADTPLGRPGQPAEVAPIFVLLASAEGSYMAGGRYAVTGGAPIL